jgi:hypothetical protein
MSVSVQPGLPRPASAFGRIRAWVSFLAAPFPDDTNARNDRRSWSVSVTTYLFFI